jgi:hypothetical protein
MNPFREINWNPGLDEKGKFAMSLIVGFPTLAAFLSLVVWLRHHMWQPFFLWLALIGLAFGLILRLVPTIAKPFYLTSYFIACCIGFVIGNGLLIVSYYFIVSPIGMLLRGLGKL